MRVVALIALQSLLHSTRRTFLLAAGLAFVSAVLVLLLALSAGTRDRFIAAASQMGSGHVSVAGFYKPDIATAIPVLTGRDAVQAVVTKSVGDIDFVVARHRGLVRLYSRDNTTRPSYLTGVTLADESRLREFLVPMPQRDGGPPGELQRLTESNTVVLFD